MNQVRKVLRGGRYRLVGAPEVNLLRKNHPYYTELGARISDIHYDDQGQKIKTPRSSRLVEIQLLRQALPF